MISNFKILCSLVHCFLLPALLSSGPTAIVYLLFQCYAEKQITLSGLWSTMIHHRETQTSYNKTEIDFEISNSTEEHNDLQDVPSKYSFGDCEVYLVPLFFFGFLFIFVFIMFLRYRLCS